MKRQYDKSGAVVPMTAAHANRISGWAYENEYAVYGFSQDENAVPELMNGKYYACLGQDTTPTGFFCFGSSARIPAEEPDTYAEKALDMGLGLRPELCGQGRGHAFVQSGLAFARDTFGAGPIRMTVAAFNLRAIRTYEKLGFRRTAAITHRISHKPFYVMLRAFP